MADDPLVGLPGSQNPFLYLRESRARELTPVLDKIRRVNQVAQGLQQGTMHRVAGERLDDLVQQSEQDPKVLHKNFYIQGRKQGLDNNHAISFADKELQKLREQWASIPQRQREHAIRETAIATGVQEGAHQTPGAGYKVKDYEPGQTWKLNARQAFDSYVRQLPQERQVALQPALLKIQLKATKMAGPPTPEEDRELDRRTYIEVMKALTPEEQKEYQQIFQETRSGSPLRTSIGRRGLGETIVDTVVGQLSTLGRAGSSAAAQQVKAIADNLQPGSLTMADVLPAEELQHRMPAGAMRMGGLDYADFEGTTKKTTRVLGQTPMEALKSVATGQPISGTLKGIATAPLTKDFGADPLPYATEMRNALGIENEQYDLTVQLTRIQDFYKEEALRLAEEALPNGSPEEIKAQAEQFYNNATDRDVFGLGVDMPMVGRYLTEVGFEASVPGGAVERLGKGAMRTLSKGAAKIPGTGPIRKHLYSDLADAGDTGEKLAAVGKSARVRSKELSNIPLSETAPDIVPAPQRHAEAFRTTNRKPIIPEDRANAATVIRHAEDTTVDSAPTRVGRPDHAPREATEVTSIQRLQQKPTAVKELPQETPTQIRDPRVSVPKEDPLAPTGKLHKLSEVTDEVRGADAQARLLYGGAKELGAAHTLTAGKGFRGQLGKVGEEAVNKRLKQLSDANDGIEFGVLGASRRADGKFNINQELVRKFKKATGVQGDIIMLPKAFADTLQESYSLSKKLKWGEVPGLKQINRIQRLINVPLRGMHTILSYSEQYALMNIVSMVGQHFLAHGIKALNPRTWKNALVASALGVMDESKFLKKGLTGKAVEALRNTKIKLKNGDVITGDELMRMLREDGAFSSSVQKVELGATKGVVGAVEGGVRGLAHSPVGLFQGQFHQLMDNMQRALVYVEALNDRSIVGRAMASDTMRKWTGLYNDIPDFEKNFLREQFMFYSFLRHSAAMIGRAIIEKPGRLQKINRGVQLLGMKGDVEEAGYTKDALSDYLKVRGVVPAIWQPSEEDKQRGDAEGAWMGQAFDFPVPGASVGPGMGKDTMLESLGQQMSASWQGAAKIGQTGLGETARAIEGALEKVFKGKEREAWQKLKTSGKLGEIFAGIEDMVLPMEETVRLAKWVKGDLSPESGFNMEAAVSAGRKHRVLFEIVKHVTLLVDEMADGKIDRHNIKLFGHPGAMLVKTDKGVGIDSGKTGQKQTEIRKGIGRGRREQVREVHRPQDLWKK